MSITWKAAALRSNALAPNDGTPNRCLVTRLSTELMLAMPLKVLGIGPKFVVGWEGNALALEVT